MELVLIAVSRASCGLLQGPRIRTLAIAHHVARLPIPIEVRPRISATTMAVESETGEGADLNKTPAGVGS